MPKVPKGKCHKCIHCETIDHWDRVKCKCYSPYGLNCKPEYCRHFEKITKKGKKTNDNKRDLLREMKHEKEMRISPNALKNLATALGVEKRHVHFLLRCAKSSLTMKINTR